MARDLFRAAALVALCLPGLCPAAEKPADLKLVPGDALFFVSFRLSELVASPPVKALLAAGPGAPGTPDDLGYFLNDLARVPPQGVERLTIAVRRFNQGAITIVHTRKPFGLPALKKELGVTREVKLSGKTVHLGKPGRLVATAVWPADSRTFVLAPPEAMAPYLAALARPAAKHSLADELDAAAGKHGITLAGFPSLAVRTAMSEPRTVVDKGGRPGKEERDGPRIETLKDEPLKLKSIEEAFDEIDVWGPFSAPFRPLMRCERALVTADIGDAARASLKAGFPSEEAAKDGLASVKMALLVARELAPRILAGSGADLSSGPAKGVLSSVVDLARAAKAERSGKTVTASLEGKFDSKSFAAFLEEQVPMARQANNLKQIAIAFHAYHDAHKALPDDIRDAKGKALLSWRVEILPYIEQQHIYRQIKRDEPWDSPHNKKVLARVPPVYAPVRGKTPEPNMTYIQRFTGPGTPWDGKRKRLTFSDISDGTSNTLMVAEANKAVHWAKPDDLKVTAKGLPKLGGQFPKFFFAAYFDGSVKQLKRGMDEKVLRLLIDPVDGKPLPPNVP